MLSSNRVLAAISLALLAAGGSASGSADAQTREVVSNQVHVSSGAAALLLEFADGGSITLEFAGGTASLNGEVIGSYEPGGEADRAWRALLDRALSLSDADIVRELGQWSPGEEMSADDAALLGDVAEVLTGAIPDAASQRATRATRDQADQADQAYQADVDEPAGAALPEGDRASREAAERASVQLDRQRQAELRQELRESLDIDEIREEIRRELEVELRDLEEELEDARAQARDSRDSNHILGFFGGMFALFGELAESAIAFVVMAALVLVATRFAGYRLDAVHREIGHRPGRSAVVGLAGGFLTLPVFVVGVVVLAITIIGIPLLFLWAPLFPLAVAAALFVGYVGVSQHVGQWVLDQKFAWLERIFRGDRNHAVSARLVGVGALMVPAVAGAVIGAVPLIGWLGVLVEVLGGLASVTAATVGFGAVIVTRGGSTGPGVWQRGLDDDYEIDDTDFDSFDMDAGDSAGGRDAGRDAGDGRDATGASDANHAGDHEPAGDHDHAGDANRDGDTHETGDASNRKDSSE